MIRKTEENKRLVERLGKEKMARMQRALDREEKQAMKLEKLIGQTAESIPNDPRSAEIAELPVHAKLAIDNRYKAMKLQAESEVRKLNAVLEERREVKQSISQKIIETNRGLIKPKMNWMYQPATSGLPAKQ